MTDQLNLPATGNSGSRGALSWDDFETRLAAALERMALDQFLILTKRPAGNDESLYFVQFAQGDRAGFLAEAGVPAGPAQGERRLARCPGRAGSVPATRSGAGLSAKHVTPVARAFGRPARTGSDMPPRPSSTTGCRSRRSSTLFAV
jgi:hypothetical protein